MKMITKKILLAAVMLALSCCAVMADGLLIRDVVAQQRWPWSKLVDIDYELVGENGDLADVRVTARDGTAVLTIPFQALSGDVSCVAAGNRRIVFDPTVTAYTNAQMLTQFNVTLTPTPSPLYMIVDLTKSAGAPGQIEYVQGGDTRLVTEGRYTNVWLDVTNDIAYATDKLVLRRVIAGSYKMGPSVDIDVTLTKSFYIGVFEVTQRQWELIMGTRPSFFSNDTCYAERPVGQVSYNLIRGAAPGVNWPTTGASVASISFIGKLRAATGVNAFDLPTDAQWEYACRAGTATVFNDGDPGATVATPHNNSNTWLDKLGRYRYDGGYLNPASTVNPENGSGDYTTANGTARVGSYAPNAWGLYDTHGNVYEWVKDLLQNPAPGGIDPVSIGDIKTRIKRGGAWHRTANQCRSSERGSDGVNTAHYSIGLRVAIDLP